MKRDLAIDAIRGLAIWSMVTFHFAAGTLLSLPTHAYPFFDGMSAFVLLSGLVLGIVYGRWSAVMPIRDIYARLGRRLATLYVCQVTISLIAVWAALRLTDADYRLLTRLPPNAGLLTQLEWALTLRFLPSGGNILLLYLLLLAAAGALLPLLVRGAWLPVLTASLTLYFVARETPSDAFVLHSFPDGAPIQNWAAWQVLFIPALVVGWKWRDWRIPEHAERRLPILAAAALTGWFALYFGMKAPGSPWHHLQPMLADKVHLGIVRAVAAWVLVFAGYGLFRTLLRHVPPQAMRPLIQTGTRSLDAYVIQAVCLVLIPIAFEMRPWPPHVAMVAALGVFALCWGWAELRQTSGLAKLHRAPDMITEWAIGEPPSPDRTPSPGRTPSPDGARRPSSSRLPGRIGQPA